MSRSVLEAFLRQSDQPRARVLQQRLARAAAEEQDTLYEQAIALAEQALWEGGVQPAQLDRYQALFREREALLAEQGEDQRHHFVLLTPVADRPRQLEDCLRSILEQCRRYAYGGTDAAGRYRKIRVLVADDSREPDNRARHRELVTKFDEQGLPCEYFSQEQQLRLLQDLPPEQRAALAGVLGEATPESFWHKGSPRMRNIASLKLLELARQHARRHERVLFHSFDSDQEFRIGLRADGAERDCHALNYFYYLDRLFRETDACVATGKVVGDPPVSPAVMAVNFVEDVRAFLARMAQRPPQADCAFHGAQEAADEAAYHDMPELFGFAHRKAHYDYPCPLSGPHDHRDCLRNFAARLNGFFYGEHPTRKTRYRYQPALASVAPARTVYPGNYVFNSEGLNYFIPFAPLKLRMNGPSMGRMLRAELGARFVSVNLPLLHRRTVADSGQSEFRPDILQQDAQVDLAGEFERQFFGDVMLFSMEALTEQGYPKTLPSAAEVEAVVRQTEARLADQYRRRQQALAEKLPALRRQMRDPGAWWNSAADAPGITAAFDAFVRNIEHNFGEDSAVARRIRAEDERAPRRDRIVAAILACPGEARAWRSMVAQRLARGAPCAS